MDLTKSYYKISEVSELLGISQPTLRYWEKEFPECAPMRTPTGRRCYTAENVRTLEIIRFLLKEKGMRTEAAKEQLRHNRRNISRRQELIDELKGLRTELKSLLTALEKRNF